MTNRFRTFSIAVSMVVVCAASSAAQEGEPAAPVERLTLEQAIERAIKVMPPTIQAEGNVRAAEAGERSALGSYLPRLSASAGTSLSPGTRVGSGVGTTIGSGINDSYRAGLSLSYDIFTGGRRGAEKAQAEAQTANAEAGLIEQTHAVTLSTRQAFYDVLRADETIRAAESRAARAREAYDAAAQRQRLGTATQSDVLRAQIEVNAAREAMLTASTQKTNAMYALGRLVGANGPVAAEGQIALEPEPLSLSSDEVVRLAVEKSPAVLASRANAVAADKGVDAAKSQYLPSLSLSAGYDWANRNAALTGGDTNWSLGVGLSFPIFNGFQREESVERARIQEEVARALASDAERLARANAQSALANLTLAEERIRINADAVEAAREDLRVNRERYSVGASTILDVLTSQSSLVEAENALIGARYDYQIARAQLEALLGRSL